MSNLDFVSASGLSRFFTSIRWLTPPAVPVSASGLSVPAPVSGLSVPVPVSGLRVIPGQRPKLTLPWPSGHGREPRPTQRPEADTKIESNSPNTVLLSNTERLEENYDDGITKTRG